MKIVLAASIFPPDIGGPATYAAGLKEAFEKLGHTVEIEVFSRLKYPSGIRHAIYAYRLFKRARGADALIAFDVLTTGLPAAVVHRLTKIPTIARIGGDFIWERYIERSGVPMPLPEFYEHRDLWSVWDDTLMHVTKFVLRSIDIAFTSTWQRQIWNHPYRLNIARTHVIENAIPPREHGEKATRHNFLHYGRDLKLKNAALFRRSFERVRNIHPTISLEEGAIAHADLLERIKKGYAVVLPSISDVTPNYIIDSIRCGKPFLLTKHSAYAEKFKDFGVFVNPLSEEDMARGLEDLLEPHMYEKLQANIAAFTDVRTYEDIAKEFLAALIPAASPSR